MTGLEEKQEQLVADYALIEDPMERLSAIVAQAKRIAELPEDLRREEDLVPGCTSRVWLIGSVEEGRCHFQLDADSPLVRGVALLLAQFYDGAPPAEVLAVEPEFLDRLRISDQLTPTRRRGMRRIRERIVEIAKG